MKVLQVKIESETVEGLKEGLAQLAKVGSKASDKTENLDCNGVRFTTKARIKEVADADTGSDDTPDHDTPAPVDD